jgi:parvulin-like peptidyl-prolyl isomerase
MAAALAPLRAEVLAKAGSEKVTREEFNAALQEEAAKLKRALSPEEKGNLLRSMVNQRLMVQEARRRKLDREPAFTAARDEFERRALTDLLYSQAIGSKSAVSLDQAREFYAQNPGLFDVAEVSQILVAVKGGDEAAAKKSAEKTADTLKRSPRAFADKAKKSSDDPQSAPRGGDLGALRRGMLVPDLEKAVFEAKPGSVVGPVRTQFGYHILHVRSLKRLSWEQAGEALQGELQRLQALQLQQALLETLSKKSTVKILVEGDKL